MCIQCHAIAARQAQRRVRVLALQRDDAIDAGLTPGPMLLAEIQCHRDRQLEAERELAKRRLHLTPSGYIGPMSRQ